MKLLTNQPNHFTDEITRWRNAVAHAGNRDRDQPFPIHFPWRASTGKWPGEVVAHLPGPDISPPLDLAGNSPRRGFTLEPFSNSSEAMMDAGYFITQTKEGTWLAASVDCPYFCFEAADVDLLDAMVRRAREFYVSAARSSKPTPTIGA